MGWTSGQSYSQDLRDRVIARVDSGLGVYEAASLFQVSVSYIYKALARRRTTGETAARQQRCTVPRRLAAHEDALRARVASNPDATIAELQAWLAECGVSASYGSVWNALDRLNLTYKKTGSRGGARSVGCRRGSLCLARAAAPLEPETAGVPR
jgi:transposase